MDNMEIIQLNYKNRIKRLLQESPNDILFTNKYKSAITLVEILQEELNTFKYDRDEDLSYLSPIFSLIGKLIVGIRCY